MYILCLKWLYMVTKLKTTLQQCMDYLPILFPNQNMSMLCFFACFHLIAVIKTQIWESDREKPRDITRIVDSLKLLVRFFLKGWKAVKFTESSNFMKSLKGIWHYYFKFKVWRNCRTFYLRTKRSFTSLSISIKHQSHVTFLIYRYELTFIFKYRYKQCTWDETWRERHAHNWKHCKSNQTLWRICNQSWETKLFFQSYY